MLRLHSFRLQNAGPFKTIDFEIRKGINVIYGLNRSSTKFSRNSNGVGKSYLFSALPESLYEEPIVGERQDRNKAGTKTITWTTPKGKKVVFIRGSGVRSGEKLSLNIDGEDKKFRTSRIAKQSLERLWPITQEEYSTYVHIDSRVPHPLVMGNSSQRKAFFTSFFGLNKIDAERKLYVAALANLKRTRAVYDELRSQYTNLKEKLADPAAHDINVSKEAKYRKTLQTLQNQFVEVQDTLRVIEYAKASKDSIEKLKSILTEVTLDEFDLKEESLKLELKDAETKLEDSIAWEQYQRDTKNYDEAFLSLSTKTKNLLLKYGKEKSEAKVKALLKESSKAESELESVEDELQSTLRFLRKEVPSNPGIVAESREELESSLRSYNHQLQHALKFKTGVCETCGSVVKVKNKDSLRAKIKNLQERLNLLNDIEQYKELIKERKKSKLQRIELKEKREELSEKVKLGRKYESVYESLINLPDKPVPFKGLKLQANVCRRMVEEIKSHLTLMEYTRPHLETIIQYLNLSQKDLEKVSQSQDLGIRINKLQELWSKYKVKIEIQENLKEQLSELRSKIKKLKIKLQDEEPLRILVQGYQDKNIKKMAVEAISERLMVLVNRYAQMILPEDFRFEFVWDTQIRLLVHRHNGKKIETSDVRKLSGAESTLFTLILVCALLSFVPDYKRCNILILDEPAARLSPELQETFKGLLKILNTLIETIIVITPHFDNYEQDHSFTIVKEKGGKSKIVAGTPQELGVN